MQRFRGQSEHSLDPKGRLNIPARFRDVLREQYDSDTLIATHWKNCLKVYPLASWEAAEEKLIRQVDEGNMPKDFGLPQATSEEIELRKRKELREKIDSSLKRWRNEHATA